MLKMAPKVNRRTCFSAVVAELVRISLGLVPFNSILSSVSSQYVP